MAEIFDPQSSFFTISSFIPFNKWTNSQNLAALPHVTFAGTVLVSTLDFPSAHQLTVSFLLLTFHLLSSSVDCNKMIKKLDFLDNSMDSYLLFLPKVERHL